MISTDPIWDQMIAEAKQLAMAEPMLADYFESAILQHQDLESAVSHILAESFVDSPLTVHDVEAVIAEELIKQEISNDKLIKLK